MSFGKILRRVRRVEGLQQLVILWLDNVAVCGGTWVSEERGSPPLAHRIRDPVQETHLGGVTSGLESRDHGLSGSNATGEGCLRQEVSHTQIEHSLRHGGEGVFGFYATIEIVVKAELVLEILESHLFLTASAFPATSSTRASASPPFGTP